MERLLFCGLILLFSCNADRKTSDKTDCSDRIEYAVFGHTRNEVPGKNYVDPRVANMDLTPYRKIILAGDVAFNSTLNDTILEKIDSLFDLGSPDTHWSPGNHDYSFPERISEYTGRPLTHVSYSNYTTWLILDSERFKGTIKPEADPMFKNVLDTISKSKNLVIVSHHLIWLQDSGILEKQADNIVNGYVGDCDWCLQPNNFYEIYYPLILQAKKRGVNVILVAGDIGHKLTTFEHITDEGVVFLACGLNEHRKAAMLILYQNCQGEMKWKFKDVE